MDSIPQARNRFFNISSCFNFLNQGQDFKYLRVGPVNLGLTSLGDVLMTRASVIK